MAMGQRSGTKKLEYDSILNSSENKVGLSVSLICFSSGLEEGKELIKTECILLGC